jgi:uncharacterized hydrophobic protein (TIGR00271 family)
VLLLAEAAACAAAAAASSDTMVQIVQLLVPKGQFDTSFYHEPCDKDREELEADFPGVFALVERLLSAHLSIADATIQLLEFGGLKVYNALVVTDATTHTIVRLRATRKRSTQLVNLLRRSIGIGVVHGYIDIMYGTSMPSFPRSTKFKKDHKRRGQFFRDDRLTDDAIYEAVDNVSHLTFDYLVMLLVACFIAAVGLISDSAVTVVASMLVSPLMGPILCIAFGVTVNDPTMMCRGVRNELIGMSICFGMGCLFGLVTGPFYGPDGFNKALLMNSTVENLLVSTEINARGSVASLLPGFFVAAPSGFGAAMAINTAGANALVGVAISVALLPPLVNCGFCVTFAAFAYTNVDEWVTKGLCVRVCVRACVVVSPSSSAAAPSSLVSLVGELARRVACFCRRRRHDRRRRRSHRRRHRRRRRRRRRRRGHRRRRRRRRSRPPPLPPPSSSSFSFLLVFFF